MSELEAEAKDTHDRIKSVKSEEGTSHVLIDVEKERKLVKKLDLYIIPMIMVTFFFSFLDRSNIGNAKIAGLSADLKLQGSQFNGTVLCIAHRFYVNCFTVAVSIFYVTYIIFEIPLTILLKMVGPSKLSKCLLLLVTSR